jgi:DNA polymerase I-like protein with 3'-5' exonuclease and polymerase domains
MKIWLDWETKDPYISMGYGPGWVFALRGYKNPEFKLLGCSIRTEDEDKAVYYTDLPTIVDKIKNATTIVNHNCIYDIGCCLVLFKQLDLVWKTYNETIFEDTVLMAKLVDQDQFSYSLADCSNRVGIVEKCKKILTDYVWDSGLYQMWYISRYKRNSHTKPKEPKLFEYAIKNLDIIPEEIVAEYCNYDVEATYSIYFSYKEQLSHYNKNFNIEFYSDLIKALIDIKKNGVRIDLEQAKKSKQLLEAYINQLTVEIYKQIGFEFNLQSSAQLVKAFKAIGIIDFPKTAKGNDSANKVWLEEQSNEICQKIVRIKNYMKLCGSFLVKIVDYQQIHLDNQCSEYRVFPNFNIFGATKTGRMSSSGYRKNSYELNFQQIPKQGEDELASRYVRSIFIPEDGEQWIGADYSNQEQRLQVEFAIRNKLESANAMMQELKSNPYADLHEVVANICGIERKPAKTINLGLSYGMGQAKLCKSLGYPTKWITTKYGIREVAGKEGEEILKKYHTFLPFMKELQDLASKALTDDGFITTIGYRRLNIDKAYWNGKELQTFEYKGLSKLIQGSAADVTMKAVVNCYRQGLKILLVVHDEICISSGIISNSKEILKECMENTYNIEVPMVVKISEGSSWAD